MCVFHSSSLEESYLLQLDRDGGRGISRLGFEKSEHIVLGFY